MQFDLSGNFMKEWVTAMEVERSLGFGRSSISNCCNGVLKQHLVLNGNINDMFCKCNGKRKLPVGGLADYSPRIHAKALQPDKVFALRVRLDYTGKIC